jgi:putative phosphoesterase
MKKIAAVSDIHGNILALEAVVADIKRKVVDVIVNLGDHLSGPLWPKETAEFLMQQEWIQISGNHDRQLIIQDPHIHGLSDAYAFNAIGDVEKEWLKKLPAIVTMDNDILLFHGTPSNDSEYLLETVEHGRARLASQSEIKERIGDSNSTVMLCGHTHVQRVVKHNNILIVNPGSVGLPAYEDDSPEYHIIESGSPDARYAILNYDNNNWNVELISVPYDFQKAVEKAKKNNRSDWAIALETGYMSR